MTTEKYQSGDKSLYKLYEQFISSSYPKFLEKLGLEQQAIRAEGAVITDSAGQEYIDCILVKCPQ